MFFTGNSSNPYIPAYALEMQILTGTRRGELPPLRRSDVHDEHIEISKAQITVKKFEDVAEHHEIVDHTKTYRDRYFPCSDILKDFLARLNKMLDNYYPGSPFLFPADTPNGVITNNAVTGTTDGCAESLALGFAEKRSRLLIHSVEMQ